MAFQNPSFLIVQVLLSKLHWWIFLFKD